MSLQSFKLLAMLGLSFSLAACGRGFHVKERSSTTFTDTRSKIDYRILLEKPQFAALSDPSTAKEPSDQKLASSVQNVRLDMDLGDSSKLFLRIRFLKIASSGAAADFTGQLQSVGNKTTFEMMSANQRYFVKGLCAESSCDHAAFVLIEKSSGKIVQVDYTRSTEYLKPEDLSKVLAGSESREDQELLRDVIEYHLPITRHSAQLAARQSGKSIVDLLVVTRPAVDNTKESFDPTPDNSQGDAPAPPVLTPAPSPAESQVIELEATSEDQKGSPAPTNQDSNTPDSAPGTEPGQSELTLTSNPYEVYDIKIPTESLRGLTIKDPLQMVSFDITPAEQQKTYEPAFRMAVLADAFVDQKVKIYRNSCNIFVRAVMTLAGYTKGGHYVANDFGTLFENKSQGLNTWQKLAFTKEGDPLSQAVNNENLTAVLTKLPNAYGTVAQVIRPGSNGHIAVVSKLNGVVYIFDASLDSHGPRKTPVKAEQLLNTGGRKNLNIYGIKGIMTSGDRSI